ncbi:MAG: RluA family pseudouridine synthase [Oligoflexia bacterium]|nr:RluA family pseudouridine synthase [Oligoflexia bacterium]
MVDLERIQAAFTSVYRCFTYWTPQECPPTVIAALTKELPHISELEWPARLQWGGFYLNGADFRSDTALTAPCRLEYYEPRYKIEDADTVFGSFKAEHIVFEDEDLIVVYKQARLPTMPGRDQTRISLKAMLEDHLGSRVHMPSRIDMSTEGLVAVSKTEKMHHRLQSVFEHRQAEKIYLLEVSGSVPWDEQLVDAPIDKDRRHPVLRTVVSSGGRAAQTLFKVRERGGRSLLEARPRTGRTHQIRVHAQHLGLPIVGDKFYGGAEAPELHLLSFRLGFIHPLSRAKMELAVPDKLLPAWTLPFESVTKNAELTNLSGVTTS